MISAPLHNRRGPAQGGGAGPVLGGGPGGFSSAPYNPARGVARAAAALAGILKMSPQGR